MVMMCINYLIIDNVTCAISIIFLLGFHCTIFFNHLEAKAILWLIIIIIIIIILLFTDTTEYLCGFLATVIKIQKCYLNNTAGFLHLKCHTKLIIANFKKKVSLYN